ncbi:SH3/FCH domain protein [Tasmannia lanceolata]|uniref:SH3/FCH domain protein n=1 Tax=Tasmannia lanceolata TaxID=3420 RepID=UPI0040638F1F
MAAPSDLSNEEVVVRRPKRGPPFKFLVPLIYAPILPLIRIGLRKNPVLRDRLFFGVLACGFLHGSYLVTDLYDSESK